MKAIARSNSNFFSFRRFVKLFKKHSIENLPSYLVSTLVLFGITTCVLGFGTYLNQGYLSPNLQGPVFMFALILGGSIFTSLIFSSLGNRSKAIPHLILPVSHFEKYLVAWLYSFLIFVVVCTLCFYGSALLILKITEMNKGYAPPLVNIVTDEKEYWLVFVLYLLIHALYFLGSIHFKSNQFISTSFVAFLGLLLLNVVNFLIARFIFQTSISSVVPFSSLEVVEGEKYWVIIPPDLGSTISGITFCIVVIVLWTSVYFKLKEREV